jgi:hypothetical protein
MVRDTNRGGHSACPWIVAEFSKELEKLWNSRKGEFFAAVGERRREGSKTAAASAGK